MQQLSTGKRLIHFELFSIGVPCFCYKLLATSKGTGQEPFAFAKSRQMSTNKVSVPESKSKGTS